MSKEDGMIILLSQEFSRRVSVSGSSPNHLKKGVTGDLDYQLSLLTGHSKDGLEVVCTPRTKLDFAICHESSHCSGVESPLKLKDIEVLLPGIEKSIAVSSGELVLAINSGGSLLRSSSGCFDFLEDQLYSGGSVLRTHEVISGTEEQSLYQTARYGDISYTITKLPSREYRIDLHFAEIVFTNGPPGMRVFDVYVQGQKVISNLDVYAAVGSNKALILCTKASVSDDGLLSIALNGVIGSPTISAICIQQAPPSLGVFPGNSTPLGINDEIEMEGSRDALAKAHHDYPQCAKEMQKGRVAFPSVKFPSSPRCTSQLETKVEELKNECHQAWISLQDANGTIERLQNELISKTFTVDTLACAVESQENELKEVKDKADGDMLRCKIALVNLNTEIEALKHQFSGFARDTKDWIASFHDLGAMFTSVQALVTENDDLKKKYAEDFQARKQLYNKVLELKGTGSALVKVMDPNDGLTI